MATKKAVAVRVRNRNRKAANKNKPAARARVRSNGARTGNGHSVRLQGDVATAPNLGDEMDLHVESSGHLIERLTEICHKIGIPLPGEAIRVAGDTQTTRPTLRGRSVDIGHHLSYAQTLITEIERHI